MKKEAGNWIKELVYKTQDTHPVLKQKLTFGQRAADKLTAFCGSWVFILIFLSFLFIWIILNVLMVLFKWDPYPFILLNLILSCIAALQAPIILMSQNRLAQKDRLTAMYDYTVDRKSEREVEKIQADISEIKTLLKKRK